MIEYITRLKCDGCGKTVDQPNSSTYTELLEWAARRGWWVDPDSIYHFCPACKVSAKLALARKAEEAAR